MRTVGTEAKRAVLCDLLERESHRITPAHETCTGPWCLYMQDALAASSTPTTGDLETHGSTDNAT